MIIVTIIAVCICSLSRPPVGPVSVSPSVSSRAKAGRVFLFPFVLFFANSHETTPFVSLFLSQSVWAKKCSTFLRSPLWRMRVLCDNSPPISQVYAKLFPSFITSLLRSDRVARILDYALWKPSPPFPGPLSNSKAIIPTPQPSQWPLLHKLYPPHWRPFFANNALLLVKCQPTAEKQIEIGGG